MLRFSTLTFCIIFCLSCLSGQTGIFEANKVNLRQHADLLDQEFKKYNLYQLDYEAIDQYTRSQGDDMDISLFFGQEHQWEINLYPRDIRGEDYNVYVQTENGVEIMPERPNMTYRGHLYSATGGNVALTINDHYFAGTVRDNGELYFIEPLHYLDKQAPKDVVVVYAVSDVIPNEGISCGADEVMKKMSEYAPEHDHGDHDSGNNTERSTGLCLEVETAIASDYLMFLDYNSDVSDVEDHTTTVWNNVAANWDDEFDDEVVFVIVTQFVSDCSSCDPWTASTNAGTLLSSFRSWGNSGGFGVPFDLGQLWTDRNFNGSTVGVAYVDGVCGSFKYQTVQDYTSTSWALRVLVAHETGHNFDALHDAPGSGFIMAPSVNNSNTWSTASQNDINATLTQRYNSGCFDECIQVEPPVADFVGDPTSGCIPLQVQFTDLTVNDPTTWSWTFPGGSPGTSTDPNPTVTYSTEGLYDVTLTVSNSAGSNTVTKFSYVNAFGAPTAAFSFIVNEDIVTFMNNSQNGTSYNWDFGDGTSSSDISPIHFYEEDGIYSVTLIATNACGSSSITLDVEVATLPEPNFTSNVTSGCVPLVIAFEDLSSSNTDFWLWEMPGAEPDQSAEQNPIVVYNTPGTYDVTLTVINEVGSESITFVNYITADPLPIPAFDFTVDGLTVDFTNTSTDAVSYSWDFGDGNSSTEENPSHTYDEGGEYIVTLIAINDCEELEVSQTVVLDVAPTASIGADTLSGCAPLTVQFLDNSTGGVDTWEWTFDGGNPSSSSDQNPEVTYENSGLFDVTLIVTNSVGSDTVTEVQYISINDVPTAGYTSSTNDATVDFTNTSTNADTYSWDFGDGNSSTDENPSHTYDEDGIYTVILTATNECGSITYEEEITIVTPPSAGFSADVTSGCVDLTVQFSDESTENATSWEWTFEGGDPSSSTDQNPSVVYDTAGSYTVTLTVTNDAGESTVTETEYIIVNDVPNAEFTSSANDATVDFTNTSTNADTYSWDFGDGNSSTDENPSHTYDEDGVYTVILTATNECGSVTYEEEITIVTPPSAGFSADVTSGCVDLTVQFSDESTENATSWEWTFEGGDPSSSTDQNPSVVYNIAGSYTVTLTVTNDAGESTVTETEYIIVNDVPNAGFTSSANDATVDFTNTSTNADTYSWDFGDGNSSTEENPSHTYDEDGVYTVILTATNECGSVTYEEEVTIVTPPSAGFSADVTSGCVDLTVQFNDESTENATSWEWTFEGGDPSSSMDQNPSVVYNTAGSYTVTLTVTNDAGESTVTETEYIIVNDVPNAGFTSSTNDATVDFTNTSTNADTYSWDFGDGNSSTEENPSHTYDEDGEYTVTLTATNECGSVTTTQTITVGTLPNAAFSSDITSGCAPLTVNFIDQSSNNTTSWEWTFEGGTPSNSTDQNPEVVFDTPGTYSVTLTAINDSGENTTTQTDYIVVNDVPTAGFTSSTNGTVTNFSNTSSDADTYSWDFGDGNSSTEANPEHDFETDGEYTVVLTATNECGSTTSTEVIVIVTVPIAGFSADVTSGCAPLTVQFTDQSSDNTTSWDWTFEGGTPSSSTDQNPEVVFDTPGSYTITLVASNSAGDNEVTQTNYIVVNDVPDAGFTSASAGLGFSFTNTSSDADSYDWDFGDGNGSTEENPDHTYDTDGDYVVTLTATNECGTNTFTMTVTAVSVPVAGFSADVTSGCAPLTVEFMNQSSDNAESFNWSFPGGDPSSSTEENPTVVYNTPGTYTVTLEVSNSAGENTTTQTDYIVVNDVPTAGFDGTITGSIINFTNNSTGATSYSWDFGDGNGSTDTNPSHDYMEDGTYTVILTAENDCGTTTWTETYEIVTEPLAGFTSDVTSGCASLTVQFLDQSSDNTTSWDWSFPGGNPSSSTDQNPIVEYDTPGGYNVTLIATTSAGSDTYTQNQYIIVNTVPTVDFSTTVNGATVNFLNNSTGATDYLWDFGDTNSSTMPNPEHTYAMDGDYTVTLTATNDCGSVTTTQTISVVSFPVAAFEADVVIGCGPLTVNYTDLSTGNVSAWNWSFSGGSPSNSTDQNPTVEYTIPGVYSVTLEVTNSAGTDVTTISSYIIVEDTPQADFDPVVTGATAIFMNTSSGGTSYDWDFGDGNGSTEESPFHVYDEDGTYTVVLTVTNSCGSVTTTQEILIVTPPNALFTVNSNNGCAPFTVQFTDQSSENTVTWAWTFEGGTPATSNEQNPVVVYNTAGVFDVTLIAGNAAGNSEAVEIDYITVGDVPTADFSTMISGATADFTDLSIDADSYDWDFGDGNGSTDPSPSHQYDEAGDYTVILTVTNACGSHTTTQIISIVGVAPVAFFTADNTVGCLPFTVNFEDLSTGEPTAWAWSFPGGSPANSNMQNPTIVYNTAGVYQVSLTVTNDFGEDMAVETSYITVEDVPTADFDFDAMDDGTVNFTNTSTGATTYEWTFGDGGMSSEENPSYQYAEAGVYTVILIATNDCGSVTIETEIDVMITNVEEIEGITMFNLFPNPNNGQFVLALDGLFIPNLEFNLYNVLGQQLHVENLDYNGGQFSKTFNFDYLASGTYIVQLKSEGKVLYRKVIID